MGASEWNRRVPYQPDIDAALRQAREDAYRDGDYYRTEADTRARQVSEQEYIAAERAFIAQEYGEDEAADMDDSQACAVWRAAQVDVTGPDTLLASQPFSGTHSVIDMSGVDDEPGFGVVAPLPGDDLRSWFGTLRPSTAAVERALGEGLSGFARWQGAYTIGYAGDQPEVIFFFGWSGD
ncbi:MAG: hypothetical protein ABW022_18420 [Actinoplanes sp.]